MKKPRTSKITTFGLGIVAMLALSVSAATAANLDPLDFSGYYAPASWTFSNSPNNAFVGGGGTIGSVDTSGAPGSITLTGGDTQNGGPGTTDFTRAANLTGIVSFNWSYTTSDSGDPINYPNGTDPAGYLLNGVFHQFTVANNSPQNGIASFSVTSGQIFGFRVATVDNEGGPGVLTISNFSAVPEPSTYLSVLSGLAILSLGMRRRRSVARATGRFVIIAALMLPVSSVFAQSKKYIASAMPNAVGPVRTVDVGAIAKTPAPPANVSGETEIDTYRHEPLPPPFAPTGTQKLLRPQTTPLAPNVAAPLAAPIFNGWTGLTHLDQRNSNGGNQFSIEPPDQALAVGSSRIFEAINDAVNVYNLNGVQQLARPLSMNEFLGLPSALNRTTGVQGPSLGDPVAFYDAPTGRFFFACYGQTVTGNVPQQQSQVYLAVSQTSDPAGVYNIYTINTTDASDSDFQGPRFPDYPHIGADANGVYISVNEFQLSSPPSRPTNFIDAAIYVLSKSAVVSGSSTTAYRIPVPYNTGFEFTIYPAVTPPGSGYFTGSGGAQFFVSGDSSVFTGTSMSVWAITNTSSLNTATPSPVLNQVIVPTQSYNLATVGQTQKEGFRPLGLSLTNPGNPDSYPNPPAALPRISAGDWRVQNACFSPGRLWATLSSEVLDSNSHKHTAACYFCFNPTIRGVTLNATVLTQGTIAVDDTNLLRSALAINPSNKGAMVFTFQGLNDYPSSAFVPINDLTVGAITISSAGKVPEDGFTGYPAVGGGNGTTRWGDYSSAMVNTDGTIYLATEYCPDINRTINANWCTYVTHYFP